MLHVQRRVQRRIELLGWKLTGLGGGGAGTSQSLSLMLRTGAASLSPERVALRLAKRASEVTRRMPMRGGVMGTGAAIWPGILYVSVCVQRMSKRRRQQEMGDAMPARRKGAAGIQKNACDRWENLPVLECAVA